MTQEQIKAKAKEYFPNDEFKQQIVIDTINWATEELQQENADLKEEINKIAFARGSLEEENAELKTKVTALENANRVMVKELDDTTSGGLNILQNVVKNKEQLTKAKEIIKKLYPFVRDKCYTTTLSENKERQSLIAEAEQFLNSEAEK